VLGSESHLEVSNNWR